MKEIADDTTGDQRACAVQVGTLRLPSWYLGGAGENQSVLDQGALVSSFTRGRNLSEECMYLTDETYRAVIVAALQAQGLANNIGDLIEETVDAMIAADRKLGAYVNEPFNPTSGGQPQDPDKGS